MLSPQDVLQKYWGYTSFRGEQLSIINHVLQKKDSVALLPTGGGKSLCYQIPAMILDGICIVVSPLIALMQDQVQQLNQRKIPALAITSGMNYYEVKKTLQKAVHEDYKFLYISPERIQTKLFKDYLHALPLNLIAVDEAHCISQWGYDFRPAYLNIRAIKQEWPNIPIIAVTATATATVLKDICTQLELNQPTIFRQSFAKPNLSFSVIKDASKINQAIKILKNLDASAIIYCKNRKQTQEVAQLLQLENLPADYYHAGLSQASRVKKQTLWMNDSKPIMVCTNAFGMGIDKPNVRVVIHYDVPDCIENYYQEAGRAGRDLKAAHAYLLYNDQDIVQLKKMIQLRFPPITAIQKVYQSIGDFLQIPIGGGMGNYYDFSFQDFCKSFKLEPLSSMYALKILEQEELLSFQEQLFIPSKVVFKADKLTIEWFEKNFPEYAHLTVCLLRNYQGILDYPSSINEKYLGKLLQLSETEVKKQLRALHQHNIISYQAQKETPQIYFNANRADARFLNIQPERYNKRKKAFEERVEAMINYLQTPFCRSQFLGNYFGDDKLQPCGICDICQKKTASITNADFKKIAKELKSLLSKPQTLQSIYEALPTFAYKQLDDVVVFLVQTNQIKSTTDGKLYWN